MKHQFFTKSVAETIELGESIGKTLSGGEVIELLGDIGSGKTTLVSGIAKGFGASVAASSPSFTIMNSYVNDKTKKTIRHFDFYRLSEPGVMANELSEYLGQESEVILIEWADTVSNLLPQDKITISIKSSNENDRQIDIEGLNL